jgi:hypothetical protein
MRPEHFLCSLGNNEKLRVQTCDFLHGLSQKRKQIYLKTKRYKNNKNRKYGDDLEFLKKGTHLQAFIASRYRLRLRMLAQ